MSGRPACFRRGDADMAEATMPGTPSAPAARPRADLVAPAVLFLAFALLPFAAAVGLQGYLLNLAIRIMIFAIAAVALDLMVGFGGLVSFGHAAFVGIGAYAVGILAAHGMTDALIALPVALAAAMLFALGTGLVCLRTSGV